MRHGFADAVLGIDALLQPERRHVIELKQDAEVHREDDDEAGRARVVDLHPTMAIQLGTVETPVGRLTVAARSRRTCLLYFDASEKLAQAALLKWYPGDSIARGADPGGAATVLRRYFDGDLHALDEVDVEMNGTEFQKRVWAALRSVKAGQTSSYAALAQRIGSPAAVRAVGAANGANPVAIIVPCHRIIGANGTLTGYGGGLQRKEWLLRHEGARLF